MIRSLMLVVALLAATPALGQDKFQPFPVAVPSHFHFVISNVFGGSLDLKLENGSVSCHRSNVGNSKSDRMVRPSKADWQKFVHALDQTKVYEWLPSYENHNVLDGGSWRIEMIAGTYDFKSTGINAYPSDEALYLTSKNGNRTRAFDAFWKATCALVGEDPSKCPL